MTARTLTDLLCDIGHLANVGRLACVSDTEILSDPNSKRALEGQFELIDRLVGEALEMAEIARRAD
ncbi:hypothetical protein [Mangrovicoccus sp. HB161399]|uniref:hypothetical protein n=1 Tax=Mangrovicoccus sp. HB161399 TaxID=2720392 RepID=UPI001557A9B5|nr:hypothetical protein [Mangrovicoccus sp. HB161399]